MVQLTSDQKQALESLIAWQEHPKKQFITLGGYAGTGKTTLLGVLRQKLLKKNKKLSVAFCSFTGKASQVLKENLSRQKAILDQDRVSTIHSLIYKAIDDSRGRVISWEKRDSIDQDLIIIDEASMITKKIWQDLLSFDRPIIAVGDHGQLPPIGDNFSLVAKPQLRLEQIHRQVADSPIIKLSQMAREDGYIPVGTYSSQVKKYSRTDPDIHSIVQDLLERWDEETLLLVGMNHTRVKLNNQIRLIKEIYSQEPTIGDRVICLKNSWEYGLYNGMLGIIHFIEPKFDGHGKKHWYQADIAMDDEVLFSGDISAYQFGASTTLPDIPGLTFAQMGELFDFGYALTVHKAQGSQARKVIIFEERNQHMSDEEWRRWLYTAVTRAQEGLIIVGN
ncbi:AAA family ATPase [Candidatus Beckwithbacteria bacterium]|nr:AAA family ATPase [Candidatus Beckwithbacteria bacterium]